MLGTRTIEIVAGIPTNPAIFFPKFPPEFRK
jgi:hypothetical protein